jgi:hypothetical protein
MPKVDYKAMTLLDGWDSYQRDVLPASAGETQRTETRRAFYAGAVMMWSSIHAASRDAGPEATAADLARMTALAKEIDDWCAALAREEV